MKTLKIFCLILASCSIHLGALQAQTPAQNKETAKRILAAVDAGDLNTFGMYVNPAMVEHMPIPPEIPMAGSEFERTKMMIAAFHAGFPDGKTSFINVVAEGSLVTIHARFSGTNTGAFMGMPATNKSVDIEQVDIIRFDAAGKAIEHWSVMDQMTMLQQLGVIPMGGK